MDTLLDAGLATSRWLQENYPQLVGFFRLISELGREEFYLAVLPLIYWSINKRLGKELAYFFLVVTIWNALLKHSFRGPRPFWLEPALALSSGEDYGVPSGHTQLATAVYLFVAAWVRKAWVWFVAITMMILMSLSRIYLGVHFIHDVAAGLLVALLLLAGYWLWQRRYAPDFAKRILGYRLMVAVLVPIAIGFIYVIVRLVSGAPDESVAWAVHLPAAERAGLEAFATAFGSLLGAGIGLTLEGSRVRFIGRGTAVQRIGRYLLGILVTVAIWEGLDLLFPADPLWLALPLRILRYLLTLLWVSFYAPMVFVRVGLAEAEPEPEIKMTPP